MCVGKSERERENDVKEPCEVRMQSSSFRGMCRMGWRIEDSNEDSK